MKLIRVLVLCEHEYWTRTLWLDEELRRMLPVLDDYLSSVYDVDLKFRFDPPIQFGDYDFSLWLTTGYIQHPTKAYNTSGWYDSTLRDAWVKINAPGWYERFAAYWRLDPWRGFQGRVSANISHEASHILAQFTEVPDHTHDFMNDYVYFDADGHQVNQAGAWRFIFQRLQ